MDRKKEGEKYENQYKIAKTVVADRKLESQICKKCNVKFLKNDIPIFEISSHASKEVGRAYEGDICYLLSEYPTNKKLEIFHQVSCSQKKMGWVVNEDGLMMKDV